MFFGGNEEDQDFLAAGGSKLASLFGGEQSSSQGNESLKYQAPKEPRKKTDVTPQTSAAAPSTLFAAAVFAYKFVDGKYASQGKLGAAIIGNHSTQEYRILLYVSKQQQVSYATISPTFVFTVAANNYASFYDDTRQNWSVMFDNQEAAIQFSQHIALAKANTANKMDSVLVQDTVIGTGAVLENGDAVEARYTAWLMHDHSFGQEFENNTKAEKFLRLKLGKGKVIKGIDEGLLGAKNQTRRLLIVPPSLGYGSSDKGNVPANSTLIYDMEIVRIKYGREREGTEAVQPDPIPAHAPTPAAKSKEEKESSRESSVRSSRETTPVEEEKPVEETGKAKLLSRIAKMGQPILPGMTGSAIDEGAGDTSAAIPVETPSASHGKPNIPAKPSSGPPTPQATTAIPFSAPQPQPAQPQPVYHPQYQHPMQAPVMMGQPEMYNSSIPPGGNQVSVFQPQMPVYPGQYGAMQYGAPMYPAAAPPPVPTPQPTAPAAMDPGMAVVTSEARQQNTEVRLTLGRLMDKVDRISEKVENFHSSQNQVSLVGSYGNSMPNMDTQTLLQSITRIIQENERLKQEVLEKGARVESQNDKIAQLLQRNQQYLEQSNSILEQTSDSYKTKAVENQSKVLSLEQEKVALVGQLGQVTGQLSSLQLELNTLRQSESDLRRQLESAVNNESQTKEQLSTVRLQLLESERRLEKTGHELKEERASHKQTTSQLAGLSEDMADTRAAKEAAEKALAEKKRSSAEEKRQLESEMDEMKTQHDHQVAALQEKLRHQRSSTDTTAKQVSELEAELTKLWEGRCEQQVTTARRTLQQSLGAVQEERDALHLQVAALEQRLSTSRSSRSDTDKQVMELEQEVEEMKVWKDKYHNLRSQAQTMKQRYEQQLQETEEERDDLMSKQSTGGAPTDITVEVKKIMNSVYKNLKQEFDPQNSYEGSDIQQTILNTVKAVTLQVVESQKQKEEPVEEVIQASSAHVTGDRGNVHYGRELDRAAKGKDTMSSIASSVESMIIPQVPHGSPRMCSSHEEPVEEVIQTSSAHVTGDRGNVHYGRELDRAETGKDTMSSIASSVESMIIPQVPHGSPRMCSSHGNDTMASITDSVESMIMPQGAPETSSNPGKSSVSLMASSVESMIIPEGMAQSLGAQPKEEIIASQVAPSVNATGKPQSKKDKPPRDLTSTVEAMILPDTAHPTGDRGNVHYGAELERTVEAMIQPAAAHPTGDRGNVHYGRQLDKEAEEKGKKKDKKAGKEKCVGEEVMVASSGGQLSAAAPPSGHHGNKNAVSLEDAVEAMIQPANAPITGDRGNIHYAEELNKAAKEGGGKAVLEKSVEAMIVPSGAPITGDKGNIHYGKELDSAAKEKGKKKDKKAGKEKCIEEEVMVASSGGQLSAAAPPSGHHGNNNAVSLVDAVEAMIQPANAPITGDRGNIHYAEELNKAAKEGGGRAVLEKSVEAMIVPSGAPITGDKGNIHYGKELDSAAKEKGKKKDKKAGKEKCVEEEVMVASSGGQLSAAAPPSGHHGNKNAVSLEDAVEAMIQPANAPITGDRGNIHYAEELNKAAKEGGSKRVLEKSVEAMVVPSGAPITGDKGNIHYGKELDSTAKDSEGKGKKNEKAKDASSSKDKSKDTKKSQNAKSDKKSASLFDDDDDLLSATSKAQEKGSAVKKTSGKKEEKKKAKTATGKEDDDLKPKPPPLFGDEDEDDLDWLS